MKPPASAASPSQAIAAAIGGAMRLPDAYRQLTEQQARLRPPLPVLNQGPVAAAATTSAAAPPRPAPILYELGLTRAALGNLRGGIDALRQAVALRPGMSAAWRRLGDLLLRANDADGAAAAHERARLCPAQDPDAGRAARPPTQAKLDSAERHVSDILTREPPHAAGTLLRQRLEAMPTDAAALRVLAEIGISRSLYPDAGRLLERALELAPGYDAARFAYVVTLQGRGRNADALPHIEMLLARDPRHEAYLATHAALLSQTGEITRSVEIYAGIADRPGTRPAQFWMGYAHALRNAGKRAEAVRAYRLALELQPTLGDAWWSLANMKDERFSPADIEAMRGHLCTPGLPEEDRLNLSYALGLALEQAGDYAASFSQYAAGARLRRAQQAYTADNWTSQIERAKAVFTEQFFAGHAGGGCADPAPIFILGLPRVGSTLIEQILASHSAVEATNELVELTTVIDETARRRGEYPEYVSALGAAELAAMGERYIELTRIYRKTDRPFFIDKMPANWSRCGLIHLILPNAKIIDARRGAMSSCFSAFKQLFSYGAEYSYDLHDLAQYYNDYAGLMAHLDRVLPGRIHRVMYESMVEHTEAEIRSLLAYCGLPFEPACLRFWESKRAVATPSSEQVRQPIFKAGLDRWKHYEPWLGPLKARLDPGLLADTDVIRDAGTDGR